MSPNDLNAYCAALTATTHVVQWGNADVWKVGGKVFVIASAGDTHSGITFKVSPMSYEVLRQMPGLRPAPYLASRGMLWIQHYAQPGLSDEDLQFYLNESYRLVANGLSKKRRREIGLDF